MGVALFGVITLLVAFAQEICFITLLYKRTPELAGSTFSMNVLSDPAFQQQLNAFRTNGDAVAWVTIAGALVGITLLFLAVRWWKGRGYGSFLGIRSAKAKQFLLWGGIFVLLVGAIEVLAVLFPVFHTDFMEKVLGSTTNFPLLILGVGILTPLYEEFLLRGLLLGSLRHIADEHTAVALSAGVFALLHLQYDWMILLMILPLAVVLGYARVRSGSIWVPIVLHMLNNVASVIFS